MINDIRTLASWYPFLPAQGVELNDSIKSVLDVKLTLFLEATAVRYPDVNDDEFSVQIIGADTDFVYAAAALADGYSLTWDISDFSAECRAASSGIALIALKIYRGRDALPAYNENYIVFDTTLDTDINDLIGLVLHPDCVYIYQEAPKLVLSINGTEYPFPIDGDEPGRYDMILRNGYNCAISYTGQSLDITCGASIGGGSVPVQVAEHCAIGMRSINGRSGDVVIRGMKGVSVGVSQELREQDRQVIVVTIDFPYTKTNMVHACADAAGC